MGDPVRLHMCFVLAAASTTTPQGWHPLLVVLQLLLGMNSESTGETSSTGGGGGTGVVRMADCNNMRIRRIDLGRKAAMSGKTVLLPAMARGLEGLELKELGDGHVGMLLAKSLILLEVRKAKLGGRCARAGLCRRRRCNRGSLMASVVGVAFVALQHLLQSVQELTA